MQLRALTTVVLACCLWVMSWLVMLPAHALTSVELTDLNYKNCPEELSEGIVGSGSSIDANCFIVYGKAINTSGKPVLNADIFGRIYDANANPVMQNRNRLGSIDEVPPGESDFEMRISVPANQPTPLQLDKFKASGFTGRVRRF
ncbi:MAG: hypothetical protein HC886_20160 [Leptolyngbyaceae cyanobacterium SM1_1_3]|nr:hypothetical protein [Leptolyngbyaceae cyanobacterium SM1_1_3]NJM85243.1 hypothetical protein [Leptolyngbyaceae cyanobacterium RM2_2_21]NJN01479.1 hypothetical protein [Leptolyngbyaceae cyanobacterium RM1_1_2]NJO08420.1 hypothetical protein [Leptolyngbyaceae cyanobacterium SL_1_1]